MNIDQIEKSIFNFLKWAEKNEFKTYDWWDIWSNKFGLFSKQKYIEKKIIGYTLVAGLTLVDLFFPSIRSFFAKKRVYPIAYSHMGLSYLQLYNISKNEQFLKKALSIVPHLLKEASPNTSGLGWGMKHKWLTVNGTIPINKACNTQTSYAYEFFKELYQITKDEKYLKYIESILLHVYSDFNETITDSSISCSYSTEDNRRVVNANSYRMYMLISGGILLSNNKYIDKGIKTLKYVLSMQDINGAWPYSEDQDFIDHYHTCFILKNLNKIIIYDKCLVDSFKYQFELGIEYYFNNLFYKNGIPKPFAKKPRLTLFKYDSYDMAEALNLLVDLRESQERIAPILNIIIKKFQTKKGWFKFRLYPSNLQIDLPYIRYANTAMFYSLTKYLNSYKGNYDKN